MISVVQAIYNRIMRDKQYHMAVDKNNVIYVTDLAQCTHKYHLRRKYPELTMAFEPALVLGELLHKGLEIILYCELYKNKTETEKTVETAVKVNDVEYKVKGRVDLVVDDVVVEIKTARKLKTTDLPFEHHVKQIQIYMNMLNLEKGIILYVTYDRIIEYEIARNRSIDIENEVRALLEDRYKPRYSWECRYCSFSQICQHAVEEENGGSRRLA